jgi:uncharacterized protein (TIGR02145 family)
MKTLLFLTVVFSGLSSFAQEQSVSFTGSGASSLVSTVKIENLTRGISVTVTGSDILRLTAPTGIDRTTYDSSAIKVYPNPMMGNATLEIMPPAAGNAAISLFDMSGKPVAGLREALDISYNKFRLSGLNAGFYIIHVKGRNYHLSGKLISNGSGGTARIENLKTGEILVTEKPVNRTLRGATNDKYLDYSQGDLLKFTGISGNYTTVVMDIPKESKVITFNFVACTDGDNNNYPVVKLGEYTTWMAENLKTTKYKDGTPVPNPTINVDTPDSWMWANEGYCWYNNDSRYKDIYGALYKLNSVKSGKLCPAGWHAPNNAEWGYLTSFLGGLTEAGGKLKENGTAHWVDPNTGATNESGFTALPGGSRNYGGEFQGIGLNGMFWSVSNCDGPGGCGWSIRFNSKGISWLDWDTHGFSVRCVFGEEPRIPEIETYPIMSLENITAMTARSEGSYIKDHGLPITQKGVCWNTSPLPNINDPHTTEGSGPNGFVTIITGLTPGTKYYVRAYATNSAGTGYGMSIPFTTKMIDVEGNLYPVSQIGKQLWLGENLRTTKYKDNTSIPYVTDQAEWSNTTTPAYCLSPGRFPDERDPEEGFLYNWYCVNTAKLCPAGWHVPSDAEWIELADYLIANGYNYDGSTTGNKIGIALSADATYENSSVAGAVGNRSYPYLSVPKSGFDGIAVGMRDNVGFSQPWMGGYWWTSSAQSVENGILYYLYYDKVGLYKENFDKNYGLSVRCLKDRIQ